MKRKEGMRHMRIKRPMNLLTLIHASINVRLLGAIAGKKKSAFPLSIGAYTFKKELKVDNESNFFSFGLYKNSSGKKAIAKMWSGRIKDLEYHTLQNESMMYQVCNTVMKRLKRSMPKRFQHMHIPNFITKLETEQSLLLLTEFVEGESADTLDSKQGLKVYLKAVDFLRYLGEKLSQEERERVSRRNAIDLALLYPFILFKAIITHPRTAKSLIRGVPIFLRSLAILSRKDQTGLGHRDLHLGNIIISKNRIAIIDLQLCVFSYLLYDYVVTMRIHWTEKGFCALLLTEINRRYGRGKDLNTMIKGLMVNSATHSLTGNSASKATVDSFIDYLDFAVNKHLKFQRLT
ncbi:aminoglycoside phosphotransferase family protein [Patescibacteria group bacterium]|nr:aminoglycoside phosphotransferase family protein [Patescibacteria group bacterium]